MKINSTKEILTPAPNTSRTRYLIAHGQINRRKILQNVLNSLHYRGSASTMYIPRYRGMLYVYLLGTMWECGERIYRMNIFLFNFNPEFLWKQMCNALSLHQLSATPGGRPPFANILILPNENTFRIINRQCVYGSRVWKWIYLFGSWRILTLNQPAMVDLCVYLPSANTCIYVGILCWSNWNVNARFWAFPSAYHMDRETLHKPHHNIYPSNIIGITHTAWYSHSYYILQHRFI